MPLPVICPLCHEDHEKQDVLTPHVFGGKVGQAFFRCQSCDAIYQYPPLSPEEEEHFYRQEFEAFMSQRAGTDGGWEGPERHIQANEDQRLRRMKYLEPLLVEKSRILEVGCSSGFMLFPLMDAGHECYGIEPSGVFSEYVKSRNLQCFESIEDLCEDPAHVGTYDIVMHFFVLEHIADPASFLKAQLQLLKPGGKLVIEIPNGADPLYTVYDIPEFEKFYWSVAHHWYFTEQSLGQLLKSLNVSYELIRDQRYDLSNHMVWARDGKPGGMKRFTDIIGQDIEDQYRDALIQSGKCDTLIAILQKDEEQ